MSVPEGTVQAVKEVIHSFVARAEDYGFDDDGAELYNKGWHIPDEHINWTHYIFYGADIRIQRLGYIRDQVIALTNTICDEDGEFVSHIEGIFDLEDEEQEVCFTWKTKNGKFLEIEEKR